MNIQEDDIIWVSDPDERLDLGEIAKDLPLNTRYVRLFAEAALAGELIRLKPSQEEGLDQ